MKKTDKILIIGIGNSGRQDDGLGWLLLDFLNEIEAAFDLEYRYQLQIEDAELISNYGNVIFVDATKEDIKNGYYLKPCSASEKHSFSTHTLRPETVLYLTKTLYNHHPNASIFGIQGYQWELKIGLSKKAKANLDKAQMYFKNNVLIDYI